MGLFDYLKRKRTNSTPNASAHGSNRSNQELPVDNSSSEAIPAPSHHNEVSKTVTGLSTGDVFDGVAEIFADVVMTQCAMLAESRAFPRMGVPIGPAVRFELCCFNLAIVYRELDLADYPYSDLRKIASKCTKLFGPECADRYGVQPVLDALQGRLNRYDEQIETKWNEDEDSWATLFGGISSDILAYILASEGEDIYLGPYQELDSDVELDTLYGRLAMCHDLGNACLSTTPHLIYIFRQWRDTGRLFELTDAELRSLIPIGSAEASAVLQRQAQNEE